MTIWRVQLPAAFLADFLGSAIPTAIAGAVAAPLIGLPPSVAFAASVVTWFGVEFSLSVAKDWPISFWSPLAFLAREFLTPALWLCAWVTRDVSWAGSKYPVQRRATPAGTKLSDEYDFAPREKSE
jgi:ceramide glucosyltransferase